MWSVGAVGDLVSRSAATRTRMPGVQNPHKNAPVAAQRTPIARAAHSGGIQAS